MTSNYTSVALERPRSHYEAPSIGIICIPKPMNIMVSLSLEADFDDFEEGDEF